MPIPEDRNKPLKNILAGLNHPRGIRMPENVQKACLVLGIKIPDYMIVGTEVPPNEQFEWTTDFVERAFKAVELNFKKMSAPDMDAQLNLQRTIADLQRNKEVVVRWINEEPHLGGRDPNQPSGVPRKPLPGADSGAIALPPPESETET